MARASETPGLPRLLARREARPALSAFAVVFVGTLIVALAQGPKVFYGDSGNYWELTSTFTHNGHFSLVNFNSPARGYVFPLFLLGLRRLGEAVGWTPSSTVKLFNVAVFSLIGTVLAPWVAEITWPEQRWGFLRRVGLTALLVVFWSGELNYPLSDFPGLAFALLTLVAISRPESPAWMLLAGAAGAAAIDVRAAYLPLVLVLAIIAALAWFDQRQAQPGLLSRRTLCVAMLAIGFAVVSLPQALSMHRHYHTWIFVPGRPEDVTQEHYDEGMRVQRYDTVLINGNAREGPYLDPTGLQILDEQPNHEIKSLHQYIGVVLSHPIAMTALLARHLINGLDMRYTTAYVGDFKSGGNLPLRLAGFLLVFLALVRVSWTAARRSLGRTRWRYPVALIVCCLSSVPTAMQTRYLLPCWLLACMLVLTPGWPRPLDRQKPRARGELTLAVLALACLAFMAVVWHVVSGVTVSPPH
jgi:hypothetical protein